MTDRPTRRWQPMFDFTRVSQSVAALLVLYLVAVLVALVVVAVLRGVSSDDRAGIGFMWWPVPLVFLVGQVVLVVDHVRRLRGGRMTTTQVTGYRAAGVICVIGSAFGLGRQWWPTVACVLLGLVLLAPTGGRATASTWTPP